ncbi:MAG: imidazole glycerol phosphate synthase subunit HisH, partial [Vicinamibacterales bacterium]
ADWRRAVRAAMDRGAALLGICLGMQWLFEGSTEAPGVAGFAAFEGICGRLPDRGTKKSERGPTPFPKVPHVGWNSLVQPQRTALLEGVAQGAHVYFTHSYVAPPTADAAATTTHGITFTSAVARGRIAGVQFHPEKSGDVGLRILRNWLNAV